MGLCINNSNNRLSIVRMNGTYCAVIFVMLYIINLNVFIYNDYFYHKSHRIEDGLRGVSPIDISDYHLYGPSWRRCALFFLHSPCCAYNIFMNLTVDIIAYIRMCRKPLILKQFLKTDIFVWFLFLCYIHPYATPIYYVVPPRILYSIALVFLIMIRLRQYKKYGIIRNWINFSKVKEMLCIKKLDFASRFRRTE